MTEPPEAVRRELDQRLLREARDRAYGREFRRFLVLFVLALVALTYGLSLRDPIGLIAGLVFAVAAIATIVRARS